MREIYLYGAGGLGTKLSELLQETSIKVLGFVDPKKSGKTVNGMQVVDFDRLPKESEVWISVLNNWVSVNNILDLGVKHGFRSVLTPPQVFSELEKLGIELDWYWLTSNSGLMEATKDSASKFFESRLDGKAWKILQNIFEYRRGGRLDEDLIIPEASQYIESGIEGFWNGPISLVDCGAYTGDTLKSIVDHGINLKNVYAFEPDFANFSRLNETFNSLDIQGFCFPAAIGDRLQVAGLQAQGTSGTNVTTLADSDNFCLLVSGDSILHNLPVTHIKMDIEGFELNALIGLQNVLRTYHPKLAISVYHKPDDLAKIPNYIEEIGGYSKWSIRTFANQTFETILYVSP